MIFSKRAILITISGVISLIIFFLYLWPAYPEIQKLYSAAGQKSEELKTEKDFETKLKEFIAEREELKNQIEIAKTALPISKAIPELIIQTADLISGNGLIANGLNIVETTPALLSVSLTIKGSYDSFKSFLRALENNLRIMDISSLTFKSPEKTTDLIEFKVNFKTYYQLVPAAVPSPEVLLKEIEENHSIIDELKNLKLHGELPIKLEPTGRPNPFISF